MKAQLVAIISLLAASSLMASPDVETPGVAVQPTTSFYTGKLYDTDLDSYIFRYRNYDPVMSRWTSADPSGFPDGVNNRRYVWSPVSQLDPDGLLVTAYYFITTGVLTIMDDDWGADAPEFRFTGKSGNGNLADQAIKGMGPLPIGDYSIYSREQGAATYEGKPAYILDPVDDTPGDDHWTGGEGDGRGNFRIHLDGSTEGCIASGDIDAIASLLNSTSHSNETKDIDTGDGTVFRGEFYLGVLHVRE